MAEFHHEKALWAPGTEEALVGRRVLLPRHEGPIAQAIRAAGAEVDAVPVTETRALPFSLPGRVDWLVLTSPVGVRMLTEADVDLADLADHIAAVGPATAAAIEATGARVDLVPPRKSDADALL
ncbi:MAG: uroporphyrinogen-III synthase, partial [Mobilicoccus sp.]|nr:uroporphyrinogen-III synthase [Mobilicoccus sp.]